ncbi:TetR/AcrR family transcriptional regulator [Glycomyces sp. TRM65418]|uniref:TetR/AcrR family transcriptional regulator n=1 Tax=Glycomyces sp. TRM65418 TaxID=2867006 RepID=UPI001CE5B3E9|nr:TetR/AcrR family transcriptional regulator [Glycomyces sp. TRM65418]MCC3762997.1 TetR/AcrR family transcriptional regulator [Glycomyces sp. TRM65418]QZD57013.1 TetR/AcrR family transcriptional regulator [Glycomyces sp. TRM65418]
MNAPRTARERARAELTAEILAAARRQLGEVGAVGLSLRSVARELGMASSAVYRYFASRDDLLTALLVESYNEIGEAAERADDPDAAPERRWLAVWRGVRGWALANRHEYALLFGTPVPGYAAPHLTAEAAGRMPLTLARIVADAKRAGTLAPPPGPACDPAAVTPEMLVILQDMAFDVEETARLVLAWNRLVAILGYELHGHLVNITADDAAFFDYTARTEGAFNGLAFD